MKRNLKLCLMLGAAILAIGASSCGKVKRGEYVKGSATIFCDDGFKNILQEEIDVFEYDYRDAHIIPSFVSEADAVDTLMADATDAIIVTHEMNQDQIKYIRDKYKKVVKQKCIAIDAVALIVNKDNPLKDISMEDLGKIMNGEYTKWSQLAQNDTAKIDIVFDNENSSTVSYMREQFLNGKKFSEIPNINVHAEQNNGQVFDIVKNKKNAIGIISVSWLGDTLENAQKVPIKERIEGYNDRNETVGKELTTEVTVLGVRNPTEKNDFTLIPYKPYQAYIATGEYPLYRKVFMITTASSSTLMKSFYDFITGFVGQKIIAKTGIMPYNVNPRIVQLK